MAGTVGGPVVVVDVAAGLGVAFGMLDTVTGNGTPCF